MKALLLGIVFIFLVGIGGLVYRNAVERPNKQIACPVDAKICPDGTAIGREGLACTFLECPPPNTSLPSLGIAYAIPTGFAPVAYEDESVAVAYAAPTESDGGFPSSEIIIRRFAIAASSTALETIRQTAVGGASGEPVKPTLFSSKEIGNHRFTVVSIERFEGVIDTAYYLARASDVLRFDAIDRGIANWTDPLLDISALPATSALAKMLSSMQAE